MSEEHVNTVAVGTKAPDVSQSSIQPISAGRAEPEGMVFSPPMPHVLEYETCGNRGTNQVFDFCDCDRQESEENHSLPSSPQPETQEDADKNQFTDDDEWEMYQPDECGESNDGVQYSEGTEWAHRSSPSFWYRDGLCRERAYNQVYIYRRPRQKPVGPTVIPLPSHWHGIEEPAGVMACNPDYLRQPLDVHLPEIERKVIEAAKKPENDGLLNWWRVEKERLANEALARIGGGM